MRGSVAAAWGKHVAMLSMIQEHSTSFNPAYGTVGFKPGV